MVIRQAIRTALLAVLLIACLLWNGCNPAISGTGSIRIGAPGGVAGILVNYVIQENNTDTTMKSFNYDMFAVEDCCAATTQFALLTLAVDAALICPEAAESLINKDSNYINLGPIIVNSDVIVVRDKDKVATIGIAQKRGYQADIARQVFGETVKIQEVSPVALGYVYETGAVDGVIIDVENSIHLTGTRISVGNIDMPVVTYVLIARKDTLSLDVLTTSFSSAAINLNNTELLQQAIDSFSRIDKTGDEAEQWKVQSNIAFVPFTPYCKCKDK